MKSGDYLFYILDDPSAASPLSSDKEYQAQLWRPTLGSVRPRGFALVPFALWWVLHQIHVFANRGYALASIYAGETLVHRTCVFPGYFRFPFMAKDDLQIGDVWTAKSHRGRGLGRVGLEIAIGSASTHRRWWYVVEQDNSASIRLAEKVGFRLHGRGVRTSLWGIKALGRFEVTEVVAERPSSHPRVAA